MKKLLFPSFKISKPRRSVFFILEDLANSGPKYLLSKKGMEHLRGQIDNLLGDFKGRKNES